MKAKAKDDENTGYLKIQILRSELEYIERSARQVSRIETGGILIGKRIKNGNIIIMKAANAGPQAEQLPVEFAPDVDYSQGILDECRKKWDVYWIGTWHKHPMHYPKPSDADIRQMKKFIDDESMLDEFIALIVTNIGGRITSNMFYMDLYKNLRKINFEIIEKTNPIIEKIRKKQHEDISEDLNRYDSRPQEKTFQNDTFPPFIRDVWYETNEGSKRLRRELKEIRRLPGVHDVRVYHGDDILTVEVIFPNFPSIIFICPPEYPLNPPRVGYMKEGEYCDFKISYTLGWNSLSMLFDILEEVLEKEDLFKEKEKSIFGFKFFWR